MVRSISFPNSNQGVKRKVCTLAELDSLESAIVQRVDAGKKATQRLSGLGLTPGIKVTKLSAAPFRGPVQIEVRSTRLAIGRGLASKILVIPNKS